MNSIVLALVINCIVFCYGIKYPYGGYKRIFRPIARCQPLEDPENGNVRQKSTIVGSGAIYTCDVGFTLNGNKIRICQRNGVYSGVAPTCELVDCGEPEPLQNGTFLTFGDTTVGSVALYICNLGFNLVGRDEVECQANGEYSDGPPLCVLIDCGQPEPPNANGILIVEETLFNSIAQYSCEEGFENIGVPIARCQENGEWSQPPTICRPLDCGPLEDLQNGNVVTMPGTTVNSVATYKCDSGFRLVGNRRRVCQTNAVWSGGHPTCQKKRRLCPKLNRISHGTLYVSGYYPGSHAIYQCYGGKRRHLRVCQSSGIWTGSEIVCPPRYYYGYKKYY